ncbi:hypothetical protein C7T35_01300 [Variovorax sp. WS11]|uniref:hypothetical protein n=1 Tax=Variovorax sp. WS11 TaxID=1105204 RepID=UPI000D0CD8FE|nr:hypothetical protein [Variovorax sp. WS11]NDZ11511.1 hypothetical protein [Variovorax sp. WS11]PSL86633.1 hypothetical protein C7T35_01300 [Variovorax sp. WS11]
MTDEEREAHIKSCGLLLLKAHREGDVEGAKHWLALQNEAIKARTPRQVARMEGCYFAEQGDLARQAAEGGTSLG